MLAKRQPVIRQRVYDLYWYFAAERQAILERRVAGRPAPWTSDPILQQYKFCNVFRATDRVSQYMIRDVIYDSQACTSEDKLFQIIAFRTFSNEATWNSIRTYLGHAPTLDDLAGNAFADALKYTKEQNNILYTGAFILCATNAYGQPAKYLNHVELFRDMFLATNLGRLLVDAQSLEQIYTLLHSYPLMGDFMSYQTAIDLNYSDIINFDENDFVKAGPGSLRGIKKAFKDTHGNTPEEIIMWMVENQDKEFDRLGLPFHGLSGRKLHAIDCQGLFCELDKYCRVAVPELKSARVRMKASFTPKSMPDALFLPPKWGVDANNY